MSRLISESSVQKQNYTEVYYTWQQFYGGITFARRSFLSLPPSAKFLYVLLKDKRRMSRQDLISSTFLPPRTVNYGLSRLKALGLIQEKEHEDDARERVYELVRVPM
jgi:DNA-binding MarR family transcriptional regulator